MKWQIRMFSVFVECNVFRILFSIKIIIITVILNASNFLYRVPKTVTSVSDEHSLNCGLIIVILSHEWAFMVAQWSRIAANTGDAGLIPGSGRSIGEENNKPLQYSCLGNSMDRGA